MKLHVDAKSYGEATVITVEVDKMKVIYKAVGSAKLISGSGKGDIDSLKAIVKELAEVLK